MTTEEQLERLAARHEALTQAVELLADLQSQSDERLRQIMDAINRLTRILESEQNRLQRLEDED